MSARSAADVPDVRPQDGFGVPASVAQVRVIRDLEGLATVRAGWERLLTDRIAADPDYFAAALQSDERLVRPHVVVLERGDEVVAVLVGRIERIELGVRIGYRALYRPKVQAVTIVEDGILGEVDESTLGMLVREVRASLPQEKADVAIFRSVPLDSPLHGIASEEGSFLTRQRGANVEIRRELELPDSLDDVLKALSSSSRQNVKRYSKKLERDYENRISHRLFTDPAELDEFFAQVEPVSAKTYQRALGVSFGDAPKDRTRTRAAMEHGWFRGYVLYLDDEPRAFHHGELYRGRFRLGRPGYDPDLAEYRLGTYLLLRVLEDLIAHPDAKYVDWGLGEADYKRRFGTRGWEESTVVLYAPTFRAARINLIRTSLLGGVGLAKRVIGKGETYQRIRSAWRRRLTSTSSS
jgi:CelD/BcsL family acetyltransferase involved in cellulose biosynthesis